MNLNKVNNMKDKEAYIDKILEDVFSLPAPKIKESRKEHISEFISSAVNGDTINAYIVIDVQIDNKPGIYIYILTNNKLIQIGIDINGKIESLTFILSQIFKIERKLTDENRMEIEISFADNSVGLRYPGDDKNINEFFQKIEQVWVNRGQGGAK